MKRNIYLKISCMFIFLTCNNFTIFSQGTVVRTADERTNHNYVQTIIPTVETTAVENLNTSNSIQELQYFDGLGRMEEIVQIATTPDRKDLVSYKEYDAYGRNNINWMSVKSDYSNGNYFPQNTVSAYSKKNYTDNNPYEKIVYESSPLNRVSERYLPGSIWHNSGKSAKTVYLTNKIFPGELQCFRYEVVKSGNNISLTKKGNYGLDNTQQLHFDRYVFNATKQVDEDGHVQIEFKNLQNQLLLVREVDGQQTNDTYYAYDDFGNLTFVIPPMASDLLKDDNTWDENNLDLRNYVYMYKYDDQNRCIAKKIPGAEWEYYVYDKAGQLVFRQDGNIRKKGEWYFYIPDILGRTVLHGTCKNSLSFPDTTIKKQLVKGAFARTTNGFRGYGIMGVTIISPILLSVNYYDNYNFMGLNGFPAYTKSDLSYESMAGYGERYAASAQELLTGNITAYTANDGILQYNYATYYYDYRGRKVQQKSTNHLGGYDKKYIRYNFGGLPVKVQCVHTNNNSVALIDIDTCTYDHAGRLLTMKHKHNTGAETLLVDNEYDDLGRLKKNKRNSNVNLVTEYTYNVRSWITGISSPGFKQALHYADGVGTPCYNGNISSMTWQVNSELIRGYKFSYDGLGRLTNALYGEGATLLEGTNHFSEQVSAYDKNGNILGLKRYGQTGVNAFNLIDNLAITLTGNQLKSVNDAVSTAVYNNAFEFKDGSKLSVEYSYDANGNLIKDLNKNITDIQYNMLNLHSLLKFSDGSTITYTYGMDGAKLRTIHKIGSATTITDYCGNVIYENGSVKRLLVEGGYLSLNDNKYHYFLEDHQGNNRVVVGQSGTAEEINHYYPFGGIFGNTGNVQPYKYNGKELDTKKGLNWYDYGAREYDAALGRWYGIDPLAENYYQESPYTYCENDPVNKVDPNGRQVRPVRPPVRRGYRNAGRPNPYAFYPRGVKPQSYMQTTSLSYTGNGLREIVPMGSQSYIETINTTGGNKVQMSSDNIKALKATGLAELSDTYIDFKKKLASFVTTVKYGENGIIQKSTEFVINDPKLAMRQLDYEAQAAKIDESLGKLDFTGKSLLEILEMSAERKSIIQDKLGVSPKDLIMIELFMNPNSFKPTQQERRTLPEFNQQ